MNSQHYIQIIAVAIIAGLSGLSWLYRKIKEQQALKRIEDEKRRREEEILRTGRDPFAAPPTPESIREQRHAHEVAVRRETELQELRRRQATAASRHASDAAPGILVQIPGARGPIIVKPIPRPNRFQPPAPTPARPPPAGRPMQPQPRPARPGRTRSGAPGARPQNKRQQQPQAPAPRHGEPARSQSDGNAKPAAPKVTPDSVHPPVVGKSMTAEDWRRAFVMRELLAPPLAVRDPDAQERDPF